MIRTANHEDIVDLLVFLEILFTIEEDFDCDSLRQKRGLELLLDTPSGTIQVDEENQEIRGMVTGQLLISTAEGTRTLLIEDLVVHPSHRHRGVGSKLLKSMGNWGHNFGANRMQLLADRNNRPALDFYASQEWQRTELICLRKYYNAI